MIYQMGWWCTTTRGEQSRPYWVTVAGSCWACRTKTEQEQRIPARQGHRRNPRLREAIFVSATAPACRPWSTK